MTGASSLLLLRLFYNYYLIEQNVKKSSSEGEPR
jgi:hypothetical protein